MKFHFGALCAAASIAALISASPALADPSGFISIGAGPLNSGINYSGGGSSYDGFSAQGIASGVYMFTPVLGAQGDILISFDRIEDSGDTVDRTGLDGALHGFYREADKFLVGGFVQFGHDSYDFDGPSAYESDRSYVGGEAQVFFENATLYGQAGMQRQSFDYSGIGYTFDGWFGTLEGRYFLTPDFRIEAHAGLSTLQFPFDLGPSAPDTLTTVNLGLGAEYKLENQPISLFVTYDYYTTSYNVSDSPSFDTHRFLIGAKFAIGEDSLLDRDRNGASLRPVQSPPSFFGGFAVP